jgi:hypothetical protein
MSELTRTQEAAATLAWTPSIYFAESVVRCPLDYAWKVLVDYQKWNPTFIGAQVQPVRGEWRKPGELVLIKKQMETSSGEPLPEFYAETVVANEPHRIIWYVYPITGQQFRNFVDFGLSEVAGGVRFSINYYAQIQRFGELTVQQQQALEKERAQGTQDMHLLVDAFKKYCETHVRSTR